MSDLCYIYTGFDGRLQHIAVDELTLATRLLWWHRWYSEPEDYITPSSIVVAL